MTDCTVETSFLAPNAGTALGDLFRMPGDWLVGLAIEHGWSPSGLSCDSLEAASTMLSLVAWLQAAILVLLLALAFESRLSGRLRGWRPKSNGPADSAQR